MHNVFNEGKRHHTGFWGVTRSSFFAGHAHPSQFTPSSRSTRSSLSSYSSCSACLARFTCSPCNARSTLCSVSKWRFRYCHRHWRPYATGRLEDSGGQSDEKMLRKTGNAQPPCCVRSLLLLEPSITFPRSLRFLGMFIDGMVWTWNPSAWTWQLASILHCKSWWLFFGVPKRAVDNLRQSQDLAV